MNQQRVSVVVPAYQSERFLADTIDGLLSQTSSISQIVVVDDGSTDATDDVARGFADRGIVLLECSHRGDAAATNAGVAATNGGIVGISDSDDIWLSNFLSDLLPECSESTVGFVYGDIQNVRDTPDLRLADHLGSVRVGLYAAPRPSIEQRWIRSADGTRT